MKEMGVDVWQGCMSTNNIPAIRKQYCGEIAFMGGFDGADYDIPNWDRETIRKQVFKALDEAESPRGYIPCIAQCGPGSIYDGVYETIFEAIDDYNELHFNINKNEIKRSPLQFEKKGYM